MYYCGFVNPNLPIDTFPHLSLLVTIILYSNLETLFLFCLLVLGRQCSDPTNMWYLSFFFFWLTSLSMMTTTFMHVAAIGIGSFFLFHDWVIRHYGHVPLLMHSSVLGHVSCFKVLAIGSSTVGYIWVQVFCLFVLRILVVYEYPVRSGTDEIYMVSLFLQFHSSVLYCYHSYTPGESHGQRSLAGCSP